MALQPILDSVERITRNLADAASEIRRGVEAVVALVEITRPIATAVSEAAGSSVSAIDQLLGNAFLVGSRRREMLEAREACDLVKFQCDRIMESLQGLSRTLAMNNTAGTRTEAEMHDRWHRFLEAVEGGDQDAFTAYKLRLNAWSVRLTKDIQMLETNETVTRARGMLGEVFRIARPSALELGIGGLCVIGLVAAAVTTIPVQGIWCLLAGLVVSVGILVRKAIVYRGASTSDEALIRLDGILKRIDGVARLFNDTSGFVDNFGEGDDPQEQVRALEDLCRKGGLPGKLVNLLNELQGKVQALA